MPKIEWPPGSGAAAVYTDDEAEILRDLVRAGEAGLISPATVEREVGIFHDLKVELAARLVPDREALEAEGLYVPPADSPFQYPASVVGALLHDQASLDLDVD